LSDPKNISPLLDGFLLGAPISEHHGVVCCPAIKENSNKKCIVKIISVPASQAQFDALMLAGAYKDPGDAMEYFRGNGEDILKEAELLKSLSKIEGFLPYDGWQMEPITRRRLGYEIYLVGSYKRSLEKFMRKNAFTHLEAVNLALDLCAALSVCRQSGYLYTDLKPSNIYVSEKKEYRIGDLGFLNLDALRYASLPERYYSPYTPPELLDPMAPMNLSVDTYAVGMILYQLYNDGHLAFTGLSPAEPLPNPVHADYELSEIIMKAIHPDPEQRWKDPKDLGKAIASYMQRNGVNDIPITPFIPLDVNPDDIVPITTEEQTEKDPSDPVVDMETEEISAPVQEVPAQEEAPLSDMSPEPDPDCTPEETADGGEIPDSDEASANRKELPHSVPYETEASEEQPVMMAEEPEVETISEAVASQPTVEEQTQPELELSEEVSKIISRADEIIAHEIPEETAFPTEPEQQDLFSFATEDTDEPDEDLVPESEEEVQVFGSTREEKKRKKNFADQTRKKKWKKFFSGCFTVLLLFCLGAAGFWYFQNVFLQTIDSLTISGTQDQITVLVDTSIEESLLKVHCTDVNGKRKTESVQGGKVIFNGLQPSTEYTLQLDIEGFHKLTGKYTDVFTTEATTQVLTFQAIAGSEDGSVLLDYTVDGDDPDFWYVHYSAEGEEERVETFTGHSATISGLTIGKVYTFTLDGGKNFDLGGETSLQYLASKLILAEDIVVTSSNGSDLTVQWKTPGDVVVENWNVRCYDGYGFEEQVTVTENSVLFAGLDPAVSYSVEITAAGMTQPSKISISADPIHISEFHMDESAQTDMKISWEYTGNKPEGGWVLVYTVDGSGSQMIPCEKASAEISPLIPGANYTFTLQAADDRSVFNNMIQYHANDSEEFSAYDFNLENVTVNLLKTPEEKNWRFETISADSYTNSFHVGESASIVLSSSKSFYLPGNKIKVLFVFRDSYGNVLPELVTEVSYVWKNIWSAGDTRNGELNIPKLPASSGEYLLELYFDGSAVAQFDVVITE